MKSCGEQGSQTLATRLAGEEDVTDQPYASKILLASGHDGAPLLLLSDLAQHGRNLAASSRASLLLDPSGGEDLDQPRLILIGDVQTLDEGPAKKSAAGRYQRLHPGSERYAGFGDFRLYRMDLTALHLVAGFGRVRWFEPARGAPNAKIGRGLYRIGRGSLAKSRSNRRSLGARHR